MERKPRHRIDRDAPTPADPLPKTKTEGDSGDTRVWDDNDTVPGVDPKTGKDHR